MLHNNETFEVWNQFESVPHVPSRGIDKESYINIAHTSLMHILVYNCYKDDSSQEFSYEESEEVIEESEEVIDGCEDQDPSWCKIYLHLCQKFTGMMKFKCKKSCNFC